MLPQISRRTMLETLATMAIGLLWSSRPSAQPKTSAQTKIPLSVYKDPSCGCCEKWVQHMNSNGFAAVVTNTTDANAIKRKHGVPQTLWSCHTAIVGGYVIEGHVPAADVKKLLAERPKAVVGLSIPGMPASAPGMDLQPFQPYTVLAFDTSGRTTVFSSHTK